MNHHLSTAQEGYLLNNKPVFHLHGCLATQVNQQRSDLANRSDHYAILQQLQPAR